jgi:hypothetical protein
MPHLLGASAGEAGVIADECAAAARAGLASAFWCDGAEALGVVANDGDGPSDVRRLFLRVVFEQGDQP